jgi:hypothetical protein
MRNGDGGASAVARLATAGEALAAGAATWFLSCVAEWPKTAPFSFGQTFAAMADHPLGVVANGVRTFEGLFPHRVLLPLLANLLGLTGDRFHLAAHGTAVLLLVAVHWCARRLGAGHVDALLVTAAVAFGGATQTYKSHVGYPDSLSFTLLLLAAMAVRSGPWFWSLNLLSAFAHEQVFFFVPLLLLLRRKLAAADWRGDALGLGVMAGVYGLFRLWIGAHASGAMAPGSYFGNGYFPLGFLGVMYFALVWCVLMFGTMLPVLAWAVLHRRAAWEPWALALLVAGITGIYAVAHDFNRFVNFLFLAVLIASLRWLSSGASRRVFVALLLAQLAVTRFAMMPVVVHFFAVMERCGCRLGGAEAELQKLITCVLPQTWPEGATFFALSAALLFAGRFLPPRVVQRAPM